MFKWPLSKTNSCRINILCPLALIQYCCGCNVRTGESERVQRQPNQHRTTPPSNGPSNLFIHFKRQTFFLADSNVNRKPIASGPANRQVIFRSKNCCHNNCCVQKSLSHSKMNNLIRAINRNTLQDILHMRIVETTLRTATKMPATEIERFAKEAEAEIYRGSDDQVDVYFSKYNSVLYQIIKRDSADLIIAIANKSVRAKELVQKRPVFGCVACDNIALEHSLFCGNDCIKNQAAVKWSNPLTPSPTTGTVSMGSNPRDRVSGRNAI